MPLGAGTGSIVERCPPESLAYPDYPLIPDGVLEIMKSLLQMSQTADRWHDDCIGVQGPVVPDDWFQTRTTADPTALYATAHVVSRCDRVAPDEAQYWRDPNEDGLAMDQSGVLRE